MLARNGGNIDRTEGYGFYDAPVRHDQAFAAWTEGNLASVPSVNHLNLSPLRCAHGFPRAHFGGTIKSNMKTFETGVRINHRLNSNSAVMYNAFGVKHLEST